MLDHLVSFINKYIDENNIEMDELNNELKNQIIKDIANNFLKSDYILNTDFFDHTMLPLVSPYRGRPLLEWNSCAHHNCNKCFNSPNELKKHLETHNCYKDYYSKSHEEVNGYYKKYNGVFVCMSSLCNFKTEDEALMRQHLRLLGINPYFRHGETIKPEEYKDFYIKTEFSKSDGLKKLTIAISNLMKLSVQNDEDVCCCCLGEKPNVVLDGCGHLVLCSNCINKISNKRCPICKQKYTNYFLKFNKSKNISTSLSQLKI